MNTRIIYNLLQLYNSLLLLYLVRVLRVEKAKKVHRWGVREVQSPDNEKNKKKRPPGIRERNCRREQSTNVRRQQ